MRNIAEIIKDDENGKQLSKTERQIAIAYIQGKYDAIRELKICINSNAIIVHGTPIPDNATNGDVIKAIFPQIIVNNIDDMSKVYTSIPFAPLKYAGANIDAVKDWWNAPYKAERSSEE